MGASADDFITARTLRQASGKAFEDREDESLETLATAAEELAMTDNMKPTDALLIVSGQTRFPYGTPKNQ